MAAWGLESGPVRQDLAQSFRLAAGSWLDSKALALVLTFSFIFRCKFSSVQMKMET